MLCSTTDPKLHNLIEDLKKEIGDLRVKEGDSLEFLGLRIRRVHNGAFHIDLSGYVSKLLDECGLDRRKSNGRWTPAEVDLAYERWNDADEVCGEPQQDWFRHILGRLMWVGTRVRPDIMWPLSCLAQHNGRARPQDIASLKRVLRYLLKFPDHGITLGLNKGEGQSVECVRQTIYSDASYAQSVRDRRSWSGIVHQVDGNRIAWSSRKQPRVTASTAAAEFTAAATACFQAELITELCEDLGEYVRKPVDLMLDSSAAQSWVEGLGHGMQAKSVACSYMAVCALEESRYLRAWHVCTDQQVADVLTKPLQRVKHANAVNLLGLEVIG